MYPLLHEILQQAKKKGLNEKTLARQAGITPETLSRAKSRDSLNTKTLEQLGLVVGLHLSLSQHPGASISEKISSGTLLSRTHQQSRHR